MQPKLTAVADEILKTNTVPLELLEIGLCHEIEINHLIIIY